MSLSERQIDDYKRALMSPLIQRIVNLQLETGSLNVLTVLDASGSMQSLWNAFIRFLEMFMHVIQVTNVNHRLMAVSDYDQGHPSQNNESHTGTPEWYTNCVTHHLCTLPQRIRQQIESAGYNAIAILGYLEEAINLVTDPNLQMTITLMVSGLQMAIDCGVTSSVAAAADTSRAKNYVFSCAPDDLDAQIDWLRQFRLGRSIPGNGGDTEEAFMTAILMAMAAALKADSVNQGEPTRLLIVVFTDTLPHLFNMSTKEARAEQEWCRRMGLPTTFVETIQLAEALGHHIVWCTNRHNEGFARNYFRPCPHMSYMSHVNMMTPDIMSVMMLNAIVGLGMVGEPLLPISLNEAQCTIMAERLKRQADFQNLVNEQMRPFQVQFINSGNHDKLTPLPMPSRDREHCTKIMQAFLAIAKHNPCLVMIMWRLAPMIYQAKKACTTVISDEFRQFLSDLRINPVLSAAIQAVFVGGKLANAEQLEKMLVSVWDKCPMSNKVLVHPGGAEPHVLEDFGRFFQPHKINEILAIFKGFQIVERGSMDCENPNLLKRKCLPQSVLLKPQFTTAVLGLAMDNKNMPPESINLKLAVVMLSSATATDILPQFRFAARSFIMKNLHYFDWLFKDDFVSDPEKNVLEVVSWWMHPIALQMLIKVMETLHTQQMPVHLIQRIEFVLRAISITKRLGDTIQFVLHYNERTPQPAGFVSMCPASEFVPETLRLQGDGCAYCQTHLALTEEGMENPYEGTQYHNDGSPRLMPTLIPGHPEIMNVYVHPDMKTRCSCCACFYSVIDGPQVSNFGRKRGRGDNDPKCVGCRQPRSGPVVSFIRTCTGCGEQWRFGTDAAAWKCANCTYPDILVDVKTFTGEVKVTIARLLSANPDFLCMYAANFGLAPRILEMMLEYQAANKNLLKDDCIFINLIRRVESDGLICDKVHFEPAKYMNIMIPAGIKIISSNWPIGPRTVAQPSYIIANMEDVVRFLSENTTPLRGKCSLGLCDVEDHLLTDLVSLCGQCTFMTCKGCLRAMTQNRPGTLTPVARLVCPCMRPIAPEVMKMVGKPNHQLTLCAGEASLAGNTDHRVGICIGAMYPQVTNGGETIYRQTCRGVRVSVVPPHQGGCGVHDPDDDETQFRCVECTRANDLYQVHLADERLSREREEAAKHQENIEAAFTETEMDIEVLKTSLPKGTIIRRCPNCKMPTWHNGGCSHMTCTNCHNHWCWVCAIDYWRTSSGCVSHLHDEHGGYMFDPPVGVLIGNFIVATGQNPAN